MQVTNDNEQSYEASCPCNLLSTKHICLVNGNEQVHDKFTNTDLSGQSTADSRSDTRSTIVRSTDCNSLSSSPELPASSESEYCATFAQSKAQNYWWRLSRQPLKLPWVGRSRALRLRGLLHLDALIQAVSALEHRRECLRTIFPLINGVGTRLVVPCHKRKLTLTELPNFDENQLDLALQLDRAADLDLETGPGWRLSLYRCDPQRHIILITLHRILDGIIPLNIIHKDLSMLYSAIIHRQDPYSSALRLSVLDRDCSTLPEDQSQLEYKSQLEYCELRLAASRPAEILCDKPRPDVLSGKMDAEHLIIEGGLLSRVYLFCASEQVSLFKVLLSAFRATHYRLTGSITNAPTGCTRSR